MVSFSISGRDGPRISRRRALLIGAGGIAAALAGPPQPRGEPLIGPVAPPPPVRFDVVALGSVIGRHEVGFRVAADGGFVADSEIDVDAKVLGVRLFRYTQKTSETWAAGRLQAFTSEGDDDGKSFAASGHAGDGGFVVEGSKGRIVAPADIMLATYWTPLMLTRTEVINPKRGNLKPQTVKPAGLVTVRVGESDRTANRYDITGALDGAVFYDQDGHWVGAAFDRKGATIDYRILV